MAFEIWMVAASWAGPVVVLFGTVFMIRRNGRSERDKETTLKIEIQSSINTINNRLDDPKTGLTAIKSSVENQEKHCIAVSTALTKEVETNRRDIDRLQKKGES